MEPEEIMCQLVLIDMALDRVMRHADEVLILLQDIKDNMMVEECQESRERQKAVSF